MIADIPAALRTPALLYFLHPYPCPEDLGRLDYLIHPPSKFSSDDRWRAFRDRTLLPMMEARPHDRELPKFLKRVEDVLAWRASVPLDNRFWRMGNGFA